MSDFKAILSSFLAYLPLFLLIVALTASLNADNNEGQAQKAGQDGAQKVDQDKAQTDQDKAKKANQDKAYKAYKEAASLEHNFEIFKAKTAYALSLQLDPDNTSYHETYAWFLTKYGFTEEAVEHFYKLLSKKFDNRDFSAPWGGILKGLAYLKSQ